MRVDCIRYPYRSQNRGFVPKLRLGEIDGPLQIMVERHLVYDAVFVAVNASGKGGQVGQARRRKDGRQLCRVKRVPGLIKDLQRKRFQVIVSVAVQHDEDGQFAGGGVGIHGFGLARRQGGEEEEGR